MSDFDAAQWLDQNGLMEQSVPKNPLEWLYGVLNARKDYTNYRTMLNNLPSEQYDAVMAEYGRRMHNGTYR